MAFHTVQFDFVHEDDEGLVDSATGAHEFAALAAEKLEGSLVHYNYWGPGGGNPSCTVLTDSSDARIRSVMLELLGRGGTYHVTPFHTVPGAEAEGEVIELR